MSIIEKIARAIELDRKSREARDAGEWEAYDFYQIGYWSLIESMDEHTYSAYRQALREA